MGPLGWCIGRVVVGVEGSLWFAGLVFGGIFGMSVGVTTFFPGTGLFFIRAFPLNVYFR